MDKQKVGIIGNPSGINNRLLYGNEVIKTFEEVEKLRGMPANCIVEDDVVSIKKRRLKRKSRP